MCHVRLLLFQSSSIARKLQCAVQITTSASITSTSVTRAMTAETIQMKIQKFAVSRPSKTLRTVSSHTPLKHLNCQTPLTDLFNENRFDIL